MKMDDMQMGTPWLDTPVMLHSDRTYKCALNHTEQCEYQQGYWRFWYEADHRYALPTVAFFMSTIILFSLAFALSHITPTSVRQSKPIRKLVALQRYLSYRNHRINALNWNTAPLGILILGLIGTIFFFCMTLGPKPYYWPNTRTLSYGGSPPLATRAGYMSLACLPFVFATAGKSNLITLVTGVSHERLQVFHRWISYAMYVLALIHTFPFIVYHVWKGDMVEEWRTSAAYWTGVVALLAQTWSTFASFGPVRKMCYEWFKFSHFVAGMVFVIFFFLHCDFRLTSWDYFIATGVLFSLSWLHRQLRIYFEHGIGHQARLQLLTNGFVEVTVPTNADWAIGQHFFVRFLALGMHAWTIHPFSACSLSAAQGGNGDLVFYIRPQGGFTARLAKYVESRPSCQIRVLLDGPYGGVDERAVSDCQRSLVVAGGSGAGWMLPFVAAFLRRKEGNLKDKASLRVVLATRDLATQSWFEEAINDLIVVSASGKRPENLVVEAYYTGSEANPSAARDAHSSFKEAKASTKKCCGSDSDSFGSDQPKSIEVQYHDLRPDVAAIVAAETEATAPNKSLSVFVCGPLSMQNDVANAAAQQQLAIMKDGSKELHLHTEHFSWA